MVHFTVTDPESEAARWCLSQYYAELDQLFEGGFDASKSLVSDPRRFASPTGTFLVGILDGRRVACGAVTLVSPDVAYLKRMWVDSSVRGVGLGRQLLRALERAAGDLGCRVVQLETHSSLVAAMSLYRSAGYEEVAPFNDELYAHHWFEKRLAPG